MTRHDRTSPSVVVLIAIAVLALVGSAAAVAAPITAASVKKVTNKQVTKFAKKSTFTWGNTDQVGFLDSASVVRATSTTLPGSVDNFDSPTYLNIGSRTVKAPTKGLFVITEQLNINRDVDDADPTLLNVRGAVDGVAATSEANVRATLSGTSDQQLSISGVIPVNAGSHVVSIQATEVGNGMAFITDRSITVLFVPFGDTGVQGVLGKTSYRPGPTTGNQ